MNPLSGVSIPIACVVFLAVAAAWADPATVNAATVPATCSAPFGADAGLSIRTRGVGRPTQMEAPASGSPRQVACSSIEPRLSAGCTTALVCAGGDIEEWWMSREDGTWMQAWAVAAPPGGVGPLVIDVSVTGATLEEVPAGASIDVPSARDWLVSGLAAWDAKRRALPIRLVASSTGFRLLVDDVDAVYPVVIDPVYATPDAVFEAPDADGYFGVLVTGLGDVNADGYDDALVGDYAYDSRRGRAYLLLGSAAGATIASTIFEGQETNTYFAYAAAGAGGDLDADGSDDFIVGAWADDDQAGLVFVYAGAPEGVSRSPVATLAVAGERGFGSAVAAGGDLDGDGFADVVVGADDSGAGDLAYVFGGSPAGVELVPSAVLHGGDAAVEFAFAVAIAGDLDGDGMDDLIVGDPYFAAEDGRADIFYGAAAGLADVADASLDGQTTGERFGYAVSGGGDVDGDGYADALVGSERYGDTRGRAQLYRGHPAGLEASPVTGWIGAEDELLGQSVAGAGDVDADGFADVIIGGQGHAYVYAGSAGGAGAEPVSTLSDGSTVFGSAVSGAGDGDGDGFADVIVGDFAYESGGPGRVYVFTGCGAGSEDADGDGHLSLAACGDDCNEGDASVHPGAVEVVADGVDQDCDGIELCYQDDDSDGYRTSDVSRTRSFACDEPGLTGAETPDGDCHDGIASIHPDADEVCNGKWDDDCDGLLDEDDAVDAATWYIDIDGDGFVDEGSALRACNQPDGHVAGTPFDCDDTDAAVNPAASEVVGDGVDQDCDGDDGQTAFDTPEVPSEEPRCGCSARGGAAATGSGLVMVAALVVRRRGLRAVESHAPALPVHDPACWSLGRSAGACTRRCSQTAAAR